MNEKKTQLSVIPQSVLEKTQGRPPRVALIDDDVEFERALARVLQAKYECVVKGYRSVEEFLEVVDQARAGNLSKTDLDLILLDFHLPGKDGPRLVEELKKRRSRLLHNSYIMGVTADSDHEVQNKFVDAGVSDILLKPLKTIDIRNIAERAYRSSAEEKRETISTIPDKYI